MPDSVKLRYKEGVDYTSVSQITQAGFIAQEVARISSDCGFKSTIVSIPEDSANSIYAINYAEFVVPLVRAVQQLSASHDSLVNEIANLKGEGQRGNNGNGVQGKQESVSQISLANNTQPIIYQNEPNPFNGSTVIRYFIPDNISGSAYIVFYDMYGKEVNKLELKERGFGKIEAHTENLAAGVYSYAIQVAGQTLDSKKMICNK